MENTKLYKKAIGDALSLMDSNLEILKEKRGKKFRINDVDSYVKVVEKLKAFDGQDESVFSLHKDSVRNHYEIIKGLTDRIDWVDEPYTEHFQTPSLMEILYERDQEFRNFTEKFMERVGESEKVIFRECMKKYCGFYGPVCVADFALTPGSTANVLNQILRTMELSKSERYYARVILASKSWGMNTSYVFGWAFMDAINNGKNAGEAVAEEIDMLKFIFDRPVDSQNEIMKRIGFKSFSSADYQKRYGKGMKDSVENALEKKVHYSNILTVPAYSIGDIGHHLCQSVYDLYSDDIALETLEAIFDVVEKTIMSGLEKYENISQILSVATGASAAAITTILESEGFTSEMVTNLMISRFQNFIQKYPWRGVGLEFHNVDFIDVAYRGSKIIHSGNGKVNGIPVILDPLYERGTVKDLRGYVYPNCGITQRFSLLMKFSDHFCFPNIEPITMGLLTNIISMNPEKSISPIEGCKKCSISSLLPNRCSYCERTRVV